MENKPKINLAIFLENKIIAVKVCRSDAEAKQLTEENQAFGYQVERGFYHFDAKINKMIWRGKGHTNRAKNAVKHVFEKSLIKSY